MNEQQLDRMKRGKGFIAALDQSGGSTPKALLAYGIPESAYSSEEEMFDLVHQMRTRIIASPAFNGERILGAILFRATMERQIEGLDTADYLWQRKHIVPFLKVDDGLADEADGVQLMKPMPELDRLLDRAVQKHIFGTKMRSVIKRHSPDGVTNIVEQQFDYALRILAAGLVPIIEPEVDIEAADKRAIEQELLRQLIDHLNRLAENHLVMLKLTLPEQPDLYRPLIQHPNVARVVALSGGYDQTEACARLTQNHGLIASFSRVLVEGLRADQPPEEFNAVLETSVQRIYKASLS